MLDRQSEQASTPETARLELSGITKHYGAVQALTDVSFAVAPGEIHALVGENGAGKSTLVGAITGLVEPDRGTMWLDGEPIAFRNPRAARASGIAAVYQDPRLFPDLDVAENIFTGTYLRAGPGIVDRRAMHQRARTLLQRVGVALDTHATVAALSIAEAQFVEIARALAVETRLLILDEPTSSLTPAETARLFEVVRRLRDAGTSIVWISHRMEEIKQLTDTVTVLRDGRHVITAPTTSLSDDDIVQHMVGRTLESLYDPHGEQHLGDVRLAVEGLTVEGEFSDVSFQVRAGEIVGMAGIVGAGRTEIAQAICGVRRPTAGRVHLHGRPVVVRKPRDMLRHGVAYVPEDRDTQGLLPPVSVLRNIALPSSWRLSRWGFLGRRREVALAREQIAGLEIKTGSVDAPVASLSGGNRQKVALARWLATRPEVLILDEPTHGIDVATKAQVHHIVHNLARESGMAVLVISSDLPEVLGLSDRVLVIANGRLVEELSRAEATQEKIMAAATGVSRPTDTEVPA